MKPPIPVRIFNNFIVFIVADVSSSPIQVSS